MVLAWCYTHGIGVKHSYKTAGEWAEKAANQGHSSAQNLLGNFYMRGEGVEQDYEMAAEWYRKAAKNGHKDAQRSLEYLKTNGLILPDDTLKINEETFGLLIYNGKNRWTRKTTANFSGNESPFEIELEGSEEEGVSDAQRKAYTDYLQKQEDLFKALQQRAKEIYKGANQQKKNKVQPKGLYIDRKGNYGWRSTKAWNGRPNAVILSDGPVQITGSRDILYHYAEMKAKRTSKDWHIGETAYINLFGELVSLTISSSGEGKDGEKLTEKEQELLQWLTTELETEKIKNDVIEYCNACYEQWSDKRIDALDLLDEISLNSIYLKVGDAEEMDDQPDICLAGDCMADDENGIAIGFRDKSLLDISEESYAF